MNEPHATVYASDTVAIGHYATAYADGAVALGNYAIAATANEVAIRAFGRTVRFHHHRGIIWRTFRRLLWTPTGLKVAVWLVSRLGGKNDWLDAAPRSTAATPTDHGPA